MAYTGSGIFDNDDAFDWLSECSKRNITRKLKPILKKMIAFKVTPREPWSDEKIENFLNLIIDSWNRNGPGKGFEESGLTYDEYVQNYVEQETTKLKAGIFPTSDYGPVEQALASIGLIAMTLGIDVGEISGSEVDTVKQRASWLKDYKVKKDLIELAVQALEKILANDLFSRERRWWLDMDNEQPESWDHMLPIKKLKQDLELKLSKF